MYRPAASNFSPVFNKGKLLFFFVTGFSNRLKRGGICSLLYTFPFKLGETRPCPLTAFYWLRQRTPLGPDATTFYFKFPEPWCFPETRPTTLSCEQELCIVHPRFTPQLFHTFGNWYGKEPRDQASTLGSGYSKEKMLCFKRNEVRKLPLVKYWTPGASDKRPGARDMPPSADSRYGLCCGQGVMNANEQTSEVNGIITFCVWCRSCR